jgi:hypothetical protein
VFLDPAPNRASRTHFAVMILQFTPPMLCFPASLPSSHWHAHSGCVGDGSGLSILRVSRFYYRHQRAANYAAGAMKKIILLIVVPLLTVVCYPQSQGAKTVVLEKNEGEKRVRRPLGSLPIPSDQFILAGQFPPPITRH